ncbi:ubiquitin carboxyl-terminal hydrolase 8 isoform X2 [Elaeis guineensis]|uniref:Ubiquitin carboxyl-terminal hydrolase n=1 Tax=Elaeis guineensis var. tenera TaxID=51953 RepID=A0A6I9QZH1_ELAGV|nr:ubiquitin carboxyl-terminal hydrolase 8 isoform X2 [Elaeis guineensis]
MDGEEAPNTEQRQDERVYLVPYRWWREAQGQEREREPGGGIPYTASPAPSSYGGPMKIINTIFNSDLVFTLQRSTTTCSCTISDDQRQRQQQHDDAEQGCCSAGSSYALLPADMWRRALRRRNGGAGLRKGSDGNWSFEEDAPVDVYPLKLRISVIRDTCIMTVKITKKDNANENYKKACKIFTVDSEMVCVWDFSGQTNLIIMNEWNRMSQDGQCQADNEIFLEIQVYDLAEFRTFKNEGKKGDLAPQQSRTTRSSCSSSPVSNGSLEHKDSDFCFSGKCTGVGSLGLTGLENLGNTCFMNSAVQCLAHTPKLVEYFIGDYTREINHHNPLGMNGEIALAFGGLLRKLWAPEKTSVSPHVFKGKLACFAPQFSGFSQHDSQELLAFLLDGLHEDLNRVKCKPYKEAKDACGRPDEEVADEYWENHLARNDSVIVDICQGQYRSRLVCPVCNKVSVTFDPFMHLSLPLPSTKMRTMTVTVFSTDGSSVPSSYTVNVPKYGKSKDLIHALSIACSLRDDESLLVAEVYSNRIIRYLEDPLDSLSLIRDGDRLAAYRLVKDCENFPLVVFTHQSLKEQYLHSITSPRWKTFGVPLIASTSSIISGSTIRDLYLKLLQPFLESKVAVLDVDQDDGKSSSSSEVTEMDMGSHMADFEATADTAEEKDFMDEFQFYLTDEKCQVMNSKIEMSESILLTGLQKQLHVLVCWQDKAMGRYNISLLNFLPEIHKSELFAERPQESVSLYACLEAFLKEEPLGPDDMWYCPSCKKHQQASKKLDLWRLPEILVIHLKRFSYTRFTKNKLETFVDFPVHDLDLSPYIANRSPQPSDHYALYAVSNHYGNMGGGHYTAYVYHEGEEMWYDFDDRHVLPVSEDNVRSSAAYVLFYRRIQPNNSDP